MSNLFINLSTFATLTSLFWLLISPKIFDSSRRWIYDDRNNNPAMFKIDRVNNIEYVRFFKQLYTALAKGDYEYLRQVASPELVTEFEKKIN